MTVRDYVLDHKVDYANGLILVGKNDKTTKPRNITQNDLDCIILGTYKRTGIYTLNVEKVKYKYTLLVTE